MRICIRGLTDKFPFSMEILFKYEESSLIFVHSIVQQMQRSLFHLSCVHAPGMTAPKTAVAKEYVNLVYDRCSMIEGLQ